jgi:hypothetical protein
LKGLTYNFRITTLGATTYSCLECCNLKGEFENCEGEFKKEMKSFVSCNDEMKDDKFIIPGLVLGAETKNTKDENLAPFNTTDQRTLQYGDTTFISISTDHPDWAPGECLNLHKYEGNFRRKSSSITQQVKY